MADKPEQVNAWLDDENGNRAADLILKPEDYTETVKLPGKKPGWMQRKHTYTAGGEELEGWDGPFVDNLNLMFREGESEEKFLNLLKTDDSVFHFFCINSLLPNVYVTVYFADAIVSENSISMMYNRDYDLEVFNESQTIILSKEVSKVVPTEILIDVHVNSSYNMQISSSALQSFISNFSITFSIFNGDEPITIEIPCGGIDTDIVSSTTKQFILKFYTDLETTAKYGYAIVFHNADYTDNKLTIV